MLQLSARKPDWQKAIADLRIDVEAKAGLVIQAVAVDTIAYLKSHTEERRPPVRMGGPDRMAHPGHWADVMGILANSYGWEVVKIPGGWRLVLSNTAAHAIYLEQRDGFFVLAGVAEPGGPVEGALVEVVGRIAPEMRVEVSARAA
jgi:hypothetical protein